MLGILDIRDIQASRISHRSNQGLLRLRLINSQCTRHRAHQECRHQFLVCLHRPHTSTRLNQEPLQFLWRQYLSHRVHLQHLCRYPLSLEHPWLLCLPQGQCQQLLHLVRRELLLLPTLFLDDPMSLLRLALLFRMDKSLLRNTLDPNHKRITLLSIASRYHKSKHTSPL